MLEDAALQPRQSPRGGARRRSGRRSGGLENAAPSVKQANRFGFKKRPACADTSSSQAHPDDSMVQTTNETQVWTQAVGAPVELEADLCAPQTAIENQQRLLKIRATADRYDYKAKQAELTDHNKQLKSAVADSVKRDEALRRNLAAQEEQINERLRSLAEELGTQATANAKLRMELSESRCQADDQKISLAKQRKECASTKADNDALQQSSHETGLRAETAEAQLKERDGQVASLQQEVEALRVSQQAEKEQNAELVQRVGDLEAQQKREREQATKDHEQATKEHEQWRAEAEAREASLAEQHTAEQARRGDCAEIAIRLCREG